MSDYYRDPRDVFAVKENEPLWVFGYGSLMWNPDFPYIRKVVGQVQGFHRSFCLISRRMRGTPATPGLVLGLDNGGDCTGMLFQVAPEKIDQCLRSLWAREMTPEEIYKVKTVPVKMMDGSNTVLQVKTFVINHQHRDYFPEPEHSEAADMISQASGTRGTNFEYLENTVLLLKKLGIDDQPMFDLYDCTKARMTERVYA